MAAGDEDERRQVRQDFREGVTMSPHELEQWLETDASREVGQKPAGGGESVGHHMGGEVVRLLRTKDADLTADDVAAMRKVVGYVHRHLAQGPPKDDVEHSRWRYSLKNWGHDPV